METISGREVWDKVGEEIVETGTPYEIKVTRREKALYREHTKFSRIIWDDFLELVDLGDKLSPEKVDEILSKHRDRLNAEQNELLNRIASKIKERLQEPIVSDSELKLRYEEVRKYFDFPSLVEGEVEIEAGPLGIMIVKIINSEIKKDFFDDSWRGRKLSIGSNSTASHAPSDVQKWIKNTILVTGEEVDGSVQFDDIQRHETFHALNHEYIEPAMVVDYPTKEQQDIYLNFKDETMAYLLERGEWVYELPRLFSSKYVVTEDSEEAVEEEIEAVAGRSIRKDALDRYGLKSFYDHERALDEQKREIRLKEISAEGEADAETQKYMNEFRAAHRELARAALLKYLPAKEDESNSDLLQRKAQLILSSQSFKEMAFKLRMVDTRSVDVEEIFKRFTDYPDVAGIAHEIAVVGNRFSIGIKNVDAVIIKLENYKKELDTVLAEYVPDYTEKQRAQEEERLNEIIVDLQKLTVV